MLKPRSDNNSTHIVYISILFIFIYHVEIRSKQYVICVLIMLIQFCKPICFFLKTFLLYQIGRRNINTYFFASISFKTIHSVDILASLISFIDKPIECSIYIILGIHRE